MRVLLEQGGHAFRNIGDLAMLLVGYRRVRQMWPTAEIGVLADDCAPLQRYMPGSLHLSCDALRSMGRRWSLIGRAHHCVPWPMKETLARMELRVRRSFPLGSRRLAMKRIARHAGDTAMHKRVLDFIESADACVFTGGGYLNDIFCKVSSPWCHFTMLDIGIRIGKPVALFGQGLGPFMHNGLWNAMKRIASKIDLLCLREGIASLELATRLGVDPSRTIVTGDDAIELVREATTEARGDLVGLNVRVASYSGANDEVRDVLTRFVSHFGRDRGVKYLVVPVSFYADANDSRDTARVLEDAGATWEECQVTSSPDDVIRQVSKCRVVVTVSYHAAVFALAQGIPVIGLALSPYYLDKFRGLQQQFGDGCYIVQRGPGMYEQLSESVREAYDRADELRGPLITSAARQVQASRQAWARLPEVIGAHNK